MKLTDFDYDLPAGLIAQYPLEERDGARMLVLDRAKGSLTHRIFRDIVEYLKPGDLLVLNDTKVLPSRLIGRRHTGGRVEVLLLRPSDGGVFSALLKPSRLKIGEEILFNEGKLKATIISKNEVRFNENNRKRIYAHGHMPLPAYVKRAAEKADRQQYQTVYARNEGAVAAPTAGLHFTHELLRQIREKGIDIATVTLHVGVGTFRPVRAENIVSHRMEEEWIRVDKRARMLLEKTRQRKGRIWAVGTTSVRALETFSDTGKHEGETGLFIYPGYVFKSVDCLVTNFHLPRTTLLMLVSAFCSYALMRRAYQEAIKGRYRFYSYGDAMIII